MEGKGDSDVFKMLRLGCAHLKHSFNASFPQDFGSEALAQQNQSLHRLAALHPLPCVCLASTCLLISLQLSLGFFLQVDMGI